MESEHRRYRIISRLGQGGFGVVYRARLEGPQGFAKDVAIKFLRADIASAQVLSRFREEARILGLVRDRAIVGVDPPIRIHGEWALVMEYIDGVSCGHLLRRGPLPARVAVELIGEVARALDVAWHQSGPDGSPLNLLHRDLKPGNLQITPTGHVKLLDFGLAKVGYGEPQNTTVHVVGTPAYMAPERLNRVETPGGDVYSLGVVLHELVTGVCPGAGGPVHETFELEGEATPASMVDEVIVLAREMRGPASLRPTARDVEARCGLLLPSLEGPGLRDWAETNVPDAPREVSDSRVGQLLTESTLAQSESTRSANRLLWVVPIGVALIVSAIGFFGLARDSGVEPAVNQALRQPFADWVMELNAQTSERSELRNVDHWDPELYQATVRAFSSFEGDRAAWKRIDQVWEVWRDVTLAVRAAGLPEVVAGIPWVESRYVPDSQSSACAKGLWQFMPETAHSMGPKFGTPLRVESCEFVDAPGVVWQPEGFSPPHPLPYRVDGRCRIPKRRGCAIDDRSDVNKSTAAAVAMLGEAWNDDAFRDTGAVVQLTVASHYVGKDGAEKGPDPSRPAFEQWQSPRPSDAPSRYFGSSADCTSDVECDPFQYPQAPHYVAKAFAAHFAAVCYYAANYPEEPAFDRWRKYTEGYCRSIEVPTRAQVALFD